MPGPFVKTWVPSANTAMNMANAHDLAAEGERQKFLAYVAGGWTCLGSSNGGKATVNSAASSKVISTISGNTRNLQDPNAPFTADMVGSNLVLAGWVNGGNNATVVITAFIDASNIRFVLVGAINETSAAATWSVTAAGAMDGVDRLTSGIANFTWAAGGVGHWWITYQSPATLQPSGNRVTKTFSGSTGAGNYNLENRWHASVTAPTGGTTTTDPTQPANNRAFSNAPTINATNANSRWHSSHSTIGDVVYGISRNTTGYIAYASMCASFATNVPAGSDYDVYMFDGFTDAQPGAFNVSNLGSNQTATLFFRDGSIDGNVNLVGWTALNNNYVGDSITTANGQDNLASNNTMDYPLSAFTVDTNHRQFKGILTDFAMAPRGPSTGALNGMSDPNTVATVNSVVWGVLFIPMYGLTANLLL